MTSAWEAIRGDSRRAPRYRLRLPASVLLFEGIEEGHLPAVLAYTKDISRDGLCLTMPTAALGCEEFQAGFRALRITLALPAGPRVEVVGRSVYALPYEGDDLGGNYLIGVNLEESKAEPIYQEFIDALSQR